jgi:membrane dipeptidase
MDVRSNKGFHSTLEKDHPYIFIDSCMQAWPDAEYGKAHLHGVTAYGVTAWTPHVPLDQAIEGLMYWHLIARKYPNISIVETADDIRRAKRERKAALLLAAQDGEFIGGKLHRIEAFYRLGLRMMLPAYNRTNLICDGCLDRTNSGLTRFGQLVVDECNRVGLLLDCTHVGRRATLEIIERSEQPIVFSHSNPAAAVDSPRNVTDEAIEACAAKGGVIGLVAWGPLVMKKGQTEWPTVDDFIDHIDHVAQLVGSVDNIGIGTDMSLGTYPDHEYDPWGTPDYPVFHAEYGRLITSDVRSPRRALKDFNDYPQIVNVIERLGKRGYSSSDVAKILGENFLRAFAQVWK